MLLDFGVFFFASSFVIVLLEHGKIVLSFASLSCLTIPICHFGDELQVE